jgi:hypothetical protein
MNPAFDYLRGFKECSPDVEELVMKTVKRKHPGVSIGELKQIFEKGLAGEYGKVYKADPDVLMSWVTSAQRSKNTTQNYLSNGLVGVHVGMTHPDYPAGLDDWHKEANKCLTSFLNGVSEEYFHPHVYDRMVLDGKIELGSMEKHMPKEYTEPDITRAKQTILRDVFLSYKSQGWTQVYFIK